MVATEAAAVRKYRAVAYLTAAAVRVALPDGWDARETPARCCDGEVEPGGWVATSARNERVEAATAARLLALVWAAEARRVDAAATGDRWED